jgi:hypothetical protein
MHSAQIQAHQIQSTECGAGWRSARAFTCARCWSLQNPTATLETAIAVETEKYPVDT